MDARSAMIVAAERLIADTGLSAVTAKAVQQAAGQANRSAVAYHFGSLDGLIEQLIASRMGPVDARRTRMLGAEEHADAPVTAAAAVDALIRPLAEQTVYRDGSRYAGFLVQTLFDPKLAHMVATHLHAGSYRRVHRMLADLCPAPAPLDRWRVDAVVKFAMTALAAHEARAMTPSERDAAVADLIAVGAAMITAPPTPPPLPEPAADPDRGP